MNNEPSYSQFCIEITTIGCHGNKGRSEVNSNDTIRYANPENTQFSANTLLVSSTMPELYLLEKNFHFQVQPHFCRTKPFHAKILIFQKFGQNADGLQGVNIIYSLSAIILKIYL